MRPGIIRTIAIKELRESFRDKRTLFLMVFLPILLYPLLLLIITQVVVTQQAKLEAKPSMMGYAGADGEHPFVTFLAQDERYRLLALDSPQHPLDPGESLDLILDLEQFPAAPAEGGTAHMSIYYSSIEEASQQAKRRLEESLAAWSDAEVDRRLQILNLDVSLARPVRVDTVDRSKPSERGGYALGSILPLLVIVTVILGAFYPAIDLTAGEKERGSIQTLFTAPISSFEIVAGKYLAVIGIAMVSGMANLLSMALLFSHNLLLAEEFLEEVDFGISFPVIAALFFIIVLIALFFSALLLTVAVLARSFKEGQNYLSPLMLVCILPATVVSLPGFEFTPQLAMVPAVNVMLLMKQVLVEGLVVEHFFLTTASTLIFTLLVLVVASKLFAQEQVVLGERGELKLLSRRSRMRPRTRPSVGEGLAVFGLVIVLLFYVGTLLQSRSALWGLVGTLWGVVLLPTLGMTYHLKLDLRRTFHLKKPSALSALAAVILGMSAWSLVALVSTWFDRHVLHTPPQFTEEMNRLLSDPELFGGWAGLVLVVVISPALCEEALCRGFLFSSLRQRVAPWALILLTGLLFGMLHLSLYRLVGTTLLGVIMGWLVYQSGSIWTSVLFHGLNNGTALLMLAIAPEMLNNDADLPLWLVGGGLLGTLMGLILIGIQRSPFRTPKRVSGSHTT